MKGILRRVGFASSEVLVAVKIVTYQTPCMCVVCMRVVCVLCVCVCVCACVCACVQVREGAMSDLQTQLREVLRENELLRREVNTHSHYMCIYHRHTMSIMWSGFPYQSLIAAIKSIIVMIHFIYVKLYLRHYRYKSKRTKIKGKSTFFY